MVLLDKFQANFIESDKLTAEQKNLIELMGRIEELSSENASRSGMLIAFNRLYTSAEKLFLREEKFMELTGSRQLKQHAQAHKTILRQLAMFTEDYKDAEGCEIDQRFFDFLESWIANHIVAIDLR